MVTHLGVETVEISHGGVANAREPFIMFRLILQLASSLGPDLEDSFPQRLGDCRVSAKPQTLEVLENLKILPITLEQMLTREKSWHLLR